jgi:hypothetical protein
VRHLTTWLCLAAFFLSSTSVYAQTLYKLTQPDGTVMYQDDPPKKGSAARIEEKVINPNANVVPIEQFPMDGDFTVPEGPAGSVQPTGPAARSKVIPLPKDDFGKPAVLPVVPEPPIPRATVGGL